MYRLKAAVLVALLISALTASVFYLSHGTSVISSDIVRTMHMRLEDTLQEKLISAESSLDAQAENLATDQRLVTELGDVRDKLLTMTPDQLKQNSNNWNKSVFDQLLNWKKNRQSEINQRASTLNETLRADRGSMAVQAPSIDWWGKAPDLVLAFATIPLNDGSLASILIAQGFAGKQLSAGKSYEKTIPVLDEINRTKAAQLGNFLWDRKMYISVTSPVMRDANHIGSVVVGYELSKEMAASLSKSMPRFVDLSIVYASPKFGTQAAESAAHRVFYSNIDESALKSAGFKPSSSSDTSAALSYEQLEIGTVYTANAGEKNEIALSRVKWTWDESQETDVLVISNHNVANARQAAFQINIVIAGLVALFTGIVLIVLLVSAILRNFTKIKDAIAKSITSGEPISGEAMKLLMGEDADSLEQYAVRPLESPADSSPENWNDMMMDFSDEANEKADAALAPETQQELQESADIEEAKPLYDEYMRLRAENNITAPMDFDSFLRRLQRNAAKIKAQYQCDDVRFQVHVSDGNVLLKPSISKKSK